MRLILTFLFLIVYLSITNAQNCKCEDELNFVINYYEENLPGFIDNVNEKNIELYNKLKKQLLKQATNYCNSETDCFKTLLLYVEYFRDNHSSLYQNNDLSIDENKKKEVEKFINSKVFKEREVIENYTPKSNFSINKIENSYQSSDELYTVAVIKSKNNFRDYVGVITNSKTPLWVKGQVKFELKKVGVNTFDMFQYDQYHSIKYYKNVKLKDGILNDRWFNIDLKNKISYNLVSGKELVFKQLDDQTNYMYIPTFKRKWIAKIDEFYQKNDSLIRAKPYLIIDVRNNGGGSDFCVSPLLEYIYTKPFYSDVVDVYSTKENIRKNIEFYESVKNDSINSKYMANEIEMMKSVKNKTFIPRNKGQIIELDTIAKKPLKVAIIMNKYCASSCETLLFWGLESDKTILVGENSGGYVGYGEVTSVRTPNFNFILTCTMTRYNKQRKFEVIGISPKYYLTNKKDWIEQTIDILKKE